MTAEEPYWVFEVTREIDLDNGYSSLPATVYPGGMKYQDIKGILEHYNLFDQYQDKDPFKPSTINCLNYWATHPTNCLAK